MRRWTNFANKSGIAFIGPNTQAIGRPRKKAGWILGSDHKIKKEFPEKEFCKGINDVPSADRIHKVLSKPHTNRIELILKPD